MANLSKLGQFLKDKSINKAAMCEALGINLSTLNGYIYKSSKRHREKPDVYILRKIADHCNVQIEDLI